ncbi:MAG: hypothetical protein LUE17_15380 [Planctomycetaceae bacterium]|nr:hypothetical protein [Planctomycetaceae bacterium]
MKQFAAIILALALAAVPATAGEPTGRQLSPQETDQAIDGVFSGAMGVVRMEADIITQKTGGMQRGSQTTYEFLRLAAPTRMLLVNRGTSRDPVALEDSDIIIVDGRNIWEVEGRRGGDSRSVSRRAFRPNLQGVQAQGLAVFIGLFLMGRDVTSATGLREDFDIVAYDEPIPNRRETTLHFVLTPKRGGETLELWMLPGQVLPWKVRSFERKEIKFPPPKPGESPRFRVEETTRVLRNVKTNLSGLPPFTAETFLLPLAGDMVIRDEQTNERMSLEAVQAELREVRREYESSVAAQ